MFSSQPNEVICEYIYAAFSTDIKITYTNCYMRGTLSLDSASPAWTSTMHGLLSLTSSEARQSLLPPLLSDGLQEYEYPVLALDAVRDSYLPSFVRDLQKRSEKLFVLTFVTRNMTEPLQNTQSILTSIPFLLPRYSANNPSGNKFAFCSNRASRRVSRQGWMYGIVALGIS